MKYKIIFYYSDLEIKIMNKIKMFIYVFNIYLIYLLKIYF